MIRGNTKNVAGPTGETMTEDGSLAAGNPRSRQSALVRLGAALAVALCALAFLAVGEASAASITTPDRSWASVRWCTDLANPMCANRIRTLNHGTQVTMECWVDDSWNNVTGTNRWFHIIVPNVVEGFVSANQVAAQQVVPHCSDWRVRRLSVANWAAKHVGQTWASSAERSLLRAHGRDWLPTNDGPIGEWSGDCWRFAWLAWAASGSAPKYGGSAYAAGSAYQNVGRLNGGWPPAGAIVFYAGAWLGGRDWGHAAIYLGNGVAVSTQGFDGAGLPIRTHTWNGILSVRGWVTAVN